MPKEDPARQLVLIDGFGDRTIVPLRKAFNWPMKHSLETKRETLHQWIDQNA